MSSRRRTLDYIVGFYTLIHSGVDEGSGDEWLESADGG